MNRFIRLPAAVRRRPFISSRKWSGAATKSTFFVRKFADADAVENKFGIHLASVHPWQMGRYARLRNFKYLAYPFFLQRMVADAARANHISICCFRNTPFPPSPPAA